MTCKIMIFTTILCVQKAFAQEAFRAICRSNDQSLASVFAKLTAHPLVCARQCQRLAFCNYWATKGNECLLGFLTTPCERNTSDRVMWVTYVKAGLLQTCNCGPGMVAFRDSCYIFPAGSYTWTQANDTCAGLGATMVELGDLFEHDFLVNQARERGYSRVWLGGSDSANEGIFKWNSGAPFTFTKWMRGQPDNRRLREDYIELIVDDSTWNDHKIDANKKNACELSCF